MTPDHVPPRQRFPWWGDAIAVGSLIVVSLGLMREHLMGTALFLGNYDRLGYFLAARLNELDALRSLGASVSWNDTLFMGFNSANLPGAVSPLSPMRLVAAFASRQEFYYWAGVCVAGLMALAGVSAYACLRKFSLGMIASGVGALVYMCSTHSMIRFAQTDTSSLLLAVLPAGVWLISFARSGNSGWHILGITFLTTLVFYSAAGPPTIYVMALWSGLALFRCFQTRAITPLMVCGLGILCALIIALPQLWGVAAELKGYVRDGGVGSSFEAVYALFNVQPYEFLRALDEELFGRSAEELARLGNNLNLSEGFQVYSGTFASLCIIAVLLRHRGEWFRLFKFRDGLFSFFAWLLVAVAAIILIKPVAEMMFFLFFKAKLIHARLSILGTLAAAVLIALTIQKCVDLATRHRIRLSSAASALGLAALILLALQGLAGRAVKPAKLDLHRPWPETAGNLLHSLAPDNLVLAVPSGVHAGRVAPATIRLRWHHVGRSPESFEVSMGRADGPRVVIGSTAARTYDIGDIDPQADYWFSLRAMDSNKASPPSAPVLAELFDPATTPALNNESPPVWLLTNRLLALLASVLVFALLAGLGHRANAWGAWAAQVLIWLIIIQVTVEAERRWNGPANRTFPVPFAANNYFIAPPDVLRSNHPAARAEVAKLLEPEKFRTIFLPEPGQFYHFVAPHMASYWGIRTVEGYLSGVPARLAALPWPNGLVGFRTISFGSAADIPWDLLGILNVRQAAIVDTPLYFDTPRDRLAPDGPYAGSAHLRFVPNPSPVLPREFFAQRTVPAQPFSGSAITTALTAEEARSSARVEGITQERGWDTAGSIRASYQGGLISIEVDPSPHPRFLVLNELYHPRWTARAGSRDLKVHAVNTVMRGVEVPPGTTVVEFAFQPYSRFPGWWLFPVGGTLLALLGVTYGGRLTVAAELGLRDIFVRLADWLRDRRKVRWLILGAAATGVNFGALYVLVDLLKVPFFLAPIFSAEIIIVLRFLANDRWVFGHPRPSWRRLGEYHMAVAGGFVVWWGISNLLVYFGVHYLLASLLAIGGSLTVNFASNFYWIWRQHRPHSQGGSANPLPVTTSLAGQTKPPSS